MAKIPGIPDLALEQIAIKAGGSAGWYLNASRKKRTTITIGSVKIDEENNTIALTEALKLLKQLSETNDER